MAAETRAVIDDTIARIEWGPVIAGAIAAAALAFVLHGFAAAIGLLVSSTAPTWRDASATLTLASGLYLLLVAIAAYGFGAYIAARMRTRMDGSGAIEFSDGMHGLLVWALATLLTGLLALAMTQTVSRLAVPSANAGPSASVAGENIIAYDLDRLFRGERRPAGDMTQTRAEAARILLTASSHRGVQADDHMYFVRLVAATTELSAPDAERRVNEVTASAKTNIQHARRNAAVIAFMTSAAALVGAAVAWAAACAGGRHREGLNTVPGYLDWGRPYGNSRSLPD